MTVPKFKGCILGRTQPTQSMWAGSFVDHIDRKKVAFSFIPAFTLAYVLLPGNHDGAKQKQ